MILIVISSITNGIDSNMRFSPLLEFYSFVWISCWNKIMKQLFNAIMRVTVDLYNTSIGLKNVFFVIFVIYFLQNIIIPYAYLAVFDICFVLFLFLKIIVLCVNWYQLFSSKIYCSQIKRCFRVLFEISFKIIESRHWSLFC